MRADPRAYWDSQFKFSQIIPDFGDCLDWLAEASAAVARARVFRRVTGAETERQWVELMEGRSHGAVRPVFVHGGYWRALDAEGHRACLPGLEAVGGPVANVEYRLMPQTRMADIVSDVAASLQALAPLDERPLLIVGHSAGAHLALEAVRRGAAPDARIVALSGVYDLRPVRWSFLRAETDLSAEESDAHSPIDGAYDPARLLVAAGADETHEFRRQAFALASASGASLFIDDGQHHMGVLKTLANPQSALIAAIETFVTASFKEQKAQA